ncbi:hypothetical protein HanPI659440_Chr12g0458711 [Helianthus annuus]|nr:hypothetical protein HanPI659440_Chr12g0458711 [Helianthus annuus]
MHYRSKSEGVPRVAVSIAFADEDWYKTLSRRATPMIQLEERAIVAAGMSMLWVPRDPRAYPVYAHKGKGYSLVNVFDPKVAGGMAVAALHEGEPGWISRIRDNFLHPSNESMTAYGNVVLGVAKDETDGPTQEPAGESAYVPLIVDPPAAAAQRKEARTKKREEKKAEDKKSTEEPAIAPICKHSSNIKLLDYVISDSLSGLDAGVKRSAPNPDDDDTLIEMLAKKQKILEEKNLAKEKQLNADRQKDWTTVCERSNRDLKSARDEVVKLKAEKIKDKQEYEHLAVVHKEKETESQARIVALEKTVEEKKSQNKALELLVEDLGADCKWLLARGIPLIVDRLVKSDELAKYMFELGGAAYDSGRKDGYGEGKAAALAKEKDHQFELFKVDCTGNYTAKRQEYEFLEFGILKVIEKLTRKGTVVETLKKVLEDADAETDGAGTSHQVLRMNGGYDRLLCLINPVVHLVVTSLGGLQCLFYHYADTLFTYA